MIRPSELRKIARGDKRKSLKVTNILRDDDMDSGVPHRRSQEEVVPCRTCDPQRGTFAYRPDHSTAAGVNFRQSSRAVQQGGYARNLCWRHWHRHQSGTTDNRRKLHQILGSNAVNSAFPQAASHQLRCWGVQRRLPISSVDQDIGIQQRGRHLSKLLVNFFAPDWRHNRSFYCTERVRVLCALPPLPRPDLLGQLLSLLIFFKPVYPRWLPAFDDHHDCPFAFCSALHDLLRNGTRQVSLAHTTSFYRVDHVLYSNYNNIITRCFLFVRRLMSAEVAQ